MLIENHSVIDLGLQWMQISSARDMAWISEIVFFSTVVIKYPHMPHQGMRFGGYLTGWRCLAGKGPCRQMKSGSADHWAAGFHAGLPLETKIGVRTAKSQRHLKKSPENSFAQENVHPRIEDLVPGRHAYNRSIWVYDMWSSPWSCRLKMMPVIWGTNHDASNISHKNDTSACVTPNGNTLFFNVLSKSINTLYFTYVHSRSLHSVSDRCIIVPPQRGTKSLSQTFNLSVLSWLKDLLTQSKQLSP